MVATNQKARDKSKVSESCNNNPCPYCQKNKRYAQHPNVPEAKCFYNRKYNGWRPKGVCEALGIAFCSKSRFRAAEESSGAKMSDFEWQCGAETNICVEWLQIKKGKM